MTSPYHYRLEVLAGTREWLTSNQRPHWATRSRRTKDWREATCLRAKEERLPKLGYARVECQLRFTDERRRDPGNWAPTAKACIDGLVDAGVFEDDDHTHVIGPDLRIGPKVPLAWRGVHLLIYPLEKK